MTAGDLITPAQLLAALNAGLACAGGHSHRWQPNGATRKRSESMIQGFQCGHCGDQVVAKVVFNSSGGCKSMHLARREYDVLCRLRKLVLQDDHHGTLEPRALLEARGFGIIVTRRFVGEDLATGATSRTGSGLSELFASAGVLLRKLHDACPEGCTMKPLDVADKLDYLRNRFGTVLLARVASVQLLDKLNDAGSRLASGRLRSTWNHGDFKPANVLTNGRKLVVLDTRLASRGVFVHDLAPFLNHVALDRNRGGRHMAGTYARIETSFLGGYGGLDDHELSALRWSQLYFMLCYLGRYRERGRLAAAYGQWRIMTFARELASRI